MSFKLGLVGLCTSHPQAWVPIIRDLSAKGIFDIEITACWDSGETREEGFAKTFAQEFDVPHSVENLEDMLGLVDGVIVHTTNWDKHIEQAEIFVNAGLPVMIDKPLAGNYRDLMQIKEWIDSGKKVFGGSSLRFAKEVGNYLSIPESERGKPHTAFGGCGVDEFNYGIHAYAMAASLFGSGIESVEFLGKGKQEHVKLNWKNGETAVLCIGKTEQWLPFYMTVVSEKRIEYIQPDCDTLYTPLIERSLAYLSGKTQTPPLSANEMIEPALAALAVNRSRQNGGGIVRLNELNENSPAYNGKAFAKEYRRARFESK